MVPELPLGCATGAVDVPAESCAKEVPVAAIQWQIVDGLTGDGLADRRIFRLEQRGRRCYGDLLLHGAGERTRMSTVRVFWTMHLQPLSMNV